MAEKITEHIKIIEFIKELELLKDATRTAWTGKGRRESVAEHSWRLAMFAIVLQSEFSELDFNKIIRMCLIHDLGETYEGDTSAVVDEDRRVKLQREEKAVLKLLEPLKKETQQCLHDLWWEYNNGEIEEAKFVKALDKMETIIQHNQGKNPVGFDYNFNLGYGRKLVEHSIILKSIREIIDQEDERMVTVVVNGNDRNLVEDSEIIELVKGFSSLAKEKVYPQHYAYLTNTKSFLRSLFFRIIDEEKRTQLLDAVKQTLFSL